MALWGCGLDVLGPWSRSWEISTSVFVYGDGSRTQRRVTPAPSILTPNPTPPKLPQIHPQNSPPQPPDPPQTLPPPSPAPQNQAHASASGPRGPGTLIGAGRKGLSRGSLIFGRFLEVVQVFVFLNFWGRSTWSPKLWKGLREREDTAWCPRRTKVATKPPVGPS